jgi:hypothetical protein
MFRRLASHVRDQWMGALALFLVLTGGSAFALAGSNTVFSDDIVNGQVKGTDVNESTLSATPLRTRVAQGGCRPAVAGTGAMVRAGAVCIDRFEASVWSKPAGGTQYGVSTDDYPCNLNGQNCKGKIFARSVKDVAPSRYISWFQAQQALANSGKRLATSAEWQAAAAGTPDPGATPGPADCNTESSDPVATGSRTNCVSHWGANDMVGNLWEWVADWVPGSTGCPGWGTFSDDYMCLSGASTAPGSPGPLIRGGDFGGGTLAGVFAVDGQQRLGGFDDIGLRGAR